ncbi:MAG TPA: DNA circularization N-terminal domain-containing protein [Aliidongia sp.]|nr:DNA circularization N-terminal domain-containing protein [Aliidongia sp.]
MAFRDSIRQGSFRGVSFKYEDAGGDNGRRGQKHEYPKRDVPLWEDLGRKGRQYRLDVFVVGADWNKQRDALIAACDQPGLGTLVHPLLGNLTVACSDCAWQESVTTLGRTDFSLTFEEGAPHDFTSSASPDTGSAVDNAGTAASQASQTSFASSFNTSGLASKVPAGAATSLLGATSAVQGAIGFVKDQVAGGAGGWFSYVTDGVKFVQAQYNDVAGAVRLATGAVNGVIASANQAVTWVANLTNLQGAGGILGSIDGLGQNLAGLVNRVSGLFTTGSGDAFTSWAQQRTAGPAATVTVNAFAASVTAAAPGAAINAFLSGTPPAPQGSAPPATKSTGGYNAATIQNVFTLQLQIASALARPAMPPAQPGTADAQVTTNAFALYDVMRQQAIVEAAGALSAFPFSTGDQAQTMSGQLTSAIDNELATVTDDNVFDAMRALRIAIIQDVAARSAGLPDTVSMTLQASLPAVVLAFRLYGDPSQAADIIARNDIRNPMFLPSGTAIEVLSNG